MNRSIGIFSLLIVLLALGLSSSVQGKNPKFNVIAFYTGINDQAHVSFVHEANKWFSKESVQHDFSYESTNN